jgi:hypothetical protein
VAGGPGNDLKIVIGTVRRRAEACDATGVWTGKRQVAALAARVLDGMAAGAALALPGNERGDTTPPTPNLKETT